MQVRVVLILSLCAHAVFSCTSRLPLLSRKRLETFAATGGVLKPERPDIENNRSCPMRIIWVLLLVRKRSYRFRAPSRKRCFILTAPALSCSPEFQLFVHLIKRLLFISLLINYSNLLVLYVL